LLALTPQFLFLYFSVILVSQVFIFVPCSSSALSMFFLYAGVPRFGYSSDALGLAYPHAA
jgi:hypothetical protein